MDLKETAKRILKLADDIEREASESTYFVCDKCNHTASLLDINDRRAKLASEEDSSMAVRRVTVNDNIACPACEGVMSYVASDSSEKYYIMAIDDEEDIEDPAISEETEVDTETEEIPPVPAPAPTVPEETPEDESPEGEAPADADVDIDKLFEDVETQAEKAKAENDAEIAPDEDEPPADIGTPQEGAPSPEDDTSSMLPGDPESEDAPIKEPQDEEGDTPPMEEAVPAEDAPEEEPPAEGEGELPPEGEETEEVSEDVEFDEDGNPIEETDEPDDGEVNLKKNKVPQFKSTEANERFASSFSRYSM